MAEDFMASTCASWSLSADSLLPARSLRRCGFRLSCFYHVATGFRSNGQRTRRDPLIFTKTEQDSCARRITQSEG